MAYISADRLGSFPTTKRGSINKLVTENSLTRLINRLVDVDGYVITSEFDDSMINYEYGAPISLWNVPLMNFEFAIRGYYFCVVADEAISGVQYLLTSLGLGQVNAGEEKTVKANIFIDRTNHDYPELWGQDSVEDANANCRAVQFTKDGEQPVFPEDYDTGNYTLYSLTILKYCAREPSRDTSGKRKDNWGWCVPPESMFKFKSKSIRDIDGGEIVLPKVQEN